MNRSDFFRKRGIVVLCALISTFLWGSAFPCMKVAYRLFAITPAAAGDQMMFGGIRFFMAGLMTVSASFFIEKEQYKNRQLSFSIVGSILFVGFVQTGMQYVFYYISMAHLTGAKGAILNGTSAFFCVIIAHFYYKGKETLSVGKVIGCLLGLAGVVVVNLGKGEIGGGFTILGEGFMLMAALMSAIGALVSKEVSHGMGPVTLCGWQFMAGGLLLMAAGGLNGGNVNWRQAGTAGFFLLLYMSFISAAAFSLWTILLKYNRMGQVTVFNFMIPVFGTILSAIVLRDNLWSPYILGSLPLVCVGIFLVNREKSDN